MDKPILLKKHIAVWEHVDAFKKEHGYTPSYKQMMEACHISRMTLAKALKDLERRNTIRRFKYGRAFHIDLITHPSSLYGKHV